MVSSSFFGNLYVTCLYGSAYFAVPCTVGPVVVVWVAATAGSVLVGGGEGTLWVSPADLCLGTPRVRSGH